MERIINTSKTLAQVLIPGTLAIPMLLNKNEQTDGLESFMYHTGLKLSIGLDLMKTAAWYFAVTNYLSQ
jgi:hypothetical protein